MISGPFFDVQEQHRFWSPTQLEDKAIEAEITECVRQEGQEEFGELTPVEERTLFREGSKDAFMELDGILKNKTQLVVIEAKHVPSPKHLKQLLERKKVLEDALQKGVLPQFRGFNSVVPVLGGNQFPTALRQLCLKQGVRPVYPSGGRYTLGRFFSTFARRVLKR
mmetsp:Transcript_9799/g.22943  ORF Transcript_9799/g.22943 Transcript_9799/m.22943 type:complete len:166 (+) Transcript_9799:337-834(+)